MSQLINKQVQELQKNNDESAINDFITQYKPFIVKTISDLKGRYLDIHNDDEFIIGLMAFNEAIEKFNPEKASFLNFAKLVIESRIKTFWSKQSHYEHTDYADIIEYTDEDLKDEIAIFEDTLGTFGIDFEMLIENSPKHQDTRKRAISIGEETSKVPEFVNHIYVKKRLPITLMSRAFEISIKIIKKSKLFIISVVIIFDKKLKYIQDWLK